MAAVDNYVLGLKGGRLTLASKAFQKKHPLEVGPVVMTLLGEQLADLTIHNLFNQPMEHLAMTGRELRVVADHGMKLGAGAEMVSAPHDMLD